MAHIRFRGKISKLNGGIFFFQFFLFSFTTGHVYLFDLRHCSVPIKVVAAHKTSVRSVAFQKVPKESKVNFLELDTFSGYCLLFFWYYMKRKETEKYFIPNQKDSDYGLFWASNRSGEKFVLVI